uniref:Uncharacterized protein n=1 Tax=Anguilla anguilla TaxID=7936 RepID=A0A0E9PP70_ANGAN
MYCNINSKILPTIIRLLIQLLIHSDIKTMPKYCSVHLILQFNEGFQLYKNTVFFCMKRDKRIFSTFVVFFMGLSSRDSS